MYEPELEFLESQPVPLCFPDGSILISTLTVWKGTAVHPEAVRLVLAWGDMVLTVTDDTYWFTLLALRKQLEARGILIGCYGGSRNVHPSGISIDMEGGYRAYKMTLGKHVIVKRDTVSIFATGDDIEPATIAEQREFYELWGNGPKEW